MQAYLFDFDGTLVDSAPDLTRALDLALGRAGLPGLGLEPVSYTHLTLPTILLV